MPKEQASDSVARIYAEALFDVALESQTVAETEQELLALQKIVNADARVRRFLETPTLRPEIKRQALQAALAGFTQPALNFVFLLIRHRRVNLFDRIVTAYHEHANMRAGIAEFTLTTAAEIAAADVEALKGVLAQKLKRQIAIQLRRNPALLGGLILTDADHQWDMSVANRLKRLVAAVGAAKPGAKLWME